MEVIHPVILLLGSYLCYGGHSPRDPVFRLKSILIQVDPIFRLKSALIQVDPIFRLKSALIQVDPIFRLNVISVLTPRSWEVIPRG
jgi:hypothetical protein